MEGPLYNSRLSMVNFYKEQLRKFDKIGIGNFTEYDIKVTDALINITRKRLSQLSSTYDTKLTPAAERWRKRKEKSKNGVRIIKNIRKQPNIL